MKTPFLNDAEIIMKEYVFYTQNVDTRKKFNQLQRNGNEKRSRDFHQLITPWTLLGKDCLPLLSNHIYAERERIPYSGGSNHMYIIYWKSSCVFGAFIVPLYLVPPVLPPCVPPTPFGGTLCLQIPIMANMKTFLVFNKGNFSAETFLNIFTAYIS